MEKEVYIDPEISTEEVSPGALAVFMPACSSICNCNCNVKCSGICSSIDP